MVDPVRLDRDTGTRAQWLPSLSVTPWGSVQVHWYDRRNSSDGLNYQIFARRSLDNGLTFMPEEVVSDVLIPQATPNDACYYTDRQFAAAIGRRHLLTWTDGRVLVGGVPQPDIFFGSKTVAAPAHNFNADNKSDILWRDQAGAVAIWLMNGTAVASAAPIASVPPTWQIVGQQDFDRDGKHDLLWRDGSGNTAIWFMSGTTVRSSTSVANVGGTWSVVGTGDLNGDGIADVLWRDGAGNTAAWLMNGASVNASGSLEVVAGWNVVANSDFNGDGKADILWRNATTGALAIWFMNGTSVLSSALMATIDNVWNVAATGDFDGDGKADLVWRDTSGNTAVWLMNGMAITGSASLGLVAGGWTVSATGDFDGDGKSDILWRNTISGDAAVWFMNGTNVVSSAAVAKVPTTWTIQARMRTSVLLAAHRARIDPNRMDSFSSRRSCALPHSANL